MRYPRRPPPVDSVGGSLASSLRLRDSCEGVYPVVLGSTYSSHHWYSCHVMSPAWNRD